MKRGEGREPRAASGPSARAFAMPGVIIQVSTSLGGLPKRSIAGGLITSLGIGGDRHAHPQVHGGPEKAILLASAEVIEELTARGYPLFPGALGENLTTRGLDIRAVQVGDRLRAGTALLQIVQARGPCSALDIYGPSLKSEIYDSRVKAGDAASVRWGLSGLYARVLEEGAVREGDPITVVDGTE